MILMMDKIIGVYLNPAVMAEVAKNPPAKAQILAHTLANAFLLNWWIALLFFQAGASTATEFLFLAGYVLAIVAFTAFAILGIEWMAHKAAAFKGGKGMYWQQLAITNLYLTPLFVVFSAAIMVLVLAFPNVKGRMPLDLLIAIVASRMNTQKISAVHGIKDWLPDIAYGLGMLAAYVVWVLLIASPIIILALMGYS